MSLFGQAPSTLLPDIVNFKLEYPLDPSGNDYEGVAYQDRDDPHIKNDIETNLSNFTASSPFSNYFYVSGNEVVFKAHCAGALTSVNAYPRCELRERPGGSDTFWNFSDEQELNATFRVTHLPDLKREVCMLQIKGNTSTSTSGTSEVFRLEYREGSQGLHMVENENTTYNYIMPYSLGQTIEARLYVNNDQVYIELTNTSTGDTFTDNYTSDYPYGYFKAGCYTQSSIWGQKNGVGDEDPDAYGEVRFSSLILGPNGGTAGCTPMVPGNRIATNVGSSSATLNWNYDSSMDHYNVRYRPVGTSTWTYEYSLQSGSVNVSGLSSSTTYQWQVRAKCADGSATSYSSGEGAQFTTTSGTTTCTPTVPGNRIATNVGSSSATLNWNYDSSMDHYNVRYRPVGTSTWAYEYSLHSGSVSVSGLSSSTTYQWQVRAKCADGSATSYSSGEGAQFTTSGGSSGGNDIVMMRKKNAMTYALDGGNGGANNQDVYLWTYSSSNVNQKWIEIDRGAGHYSYQKLNTNFCIDGRDGGAPQQYIRLYTCDSNEEDQQWKKIDMGNGAFRLEKRNAESYSIDGQGGGSNGQRAWLWTNNNNNQNQHWVFEVVGTSSLVEQGNDSEELMIPQDKLTAYPNPFGTQLTIAVPDRIDASQSRVQLVDMLGRIVFEQQNIQAGDRFEILQNQQSGIYILQWLDQDGQLIEAKKLLRL